MTIVLLMILSLLTFTEYSTDMKENLNKKEKVLTVKKCNDFSITGKGESPEWDKAPWQEMGAREQGDGIYRSRFKIMYSGKGIYVLFDGEDKKISTDLGDFSNVWEGDVFEVFLRPDMRYPLYFEYEINPLNSELVLIIPNIDHKFLGWLPWHYDGDRKVKKAVYIEGGEAKSGAEIKSWRAELFFPYEILTPMANVPPKSGMKWRGNFYRMDYDKEETVHWSWSPVDLSFHEYEKFGTLVFE